MNIQEAREIHESFRKYSAEELTAAAANLYSNIVKLCEHVKDMFTKYPALKTYMNVSIMVMASGSDELDLCMQNIIGKHIEVFKEALEK